MRHPSVRAVYSYWNELRGSQPTPARTEIDPRALAPQLGDVFLLEGDRNGMRFRLAGSRIVHAMGDGLTGKAFSSLWQDDAKAGGDEALRTVIESEEPMLLGIRMPEPGEAPPRPAEPPPRMPMSWLNLRPQPGPRADRRSLHTLAGEVILLPLRHAPRAGLRVLGCLGLFEPPAMPRPEPGRLSISGGRMLGRTAAPLRGADLMTGASASRVISRHGHLVVMRGDLDTSAPGPDNQA